MSEVFRELASHRESQIHEGHLMGGHVHMLVVKGVNRRFERLTWVGKGLN